MTWKLVLLTFAFFTFYFTPLLKPSSGTGRVPAAEDETKYGWKVTFEDEFINRDQAISQGSPTHCFDLPPQCLVQYWSQKECRSEVHQNLRNLNKCVWRVYDMYNWMDFDAPESQGVNAFDASQVEIKDGNLILYASRSSYLKSDFDCKKKFFDTTIGWDNYTKKCPFISGGIQSQSHWNGGKEMGFAQEYGRFEVRAILPDGPGNWPAHWMLPDKDVDTNSSGKGCGWPVSGEIDIMEIWSDSKGYKGGLITGDCEKNIAGNKGGYGKASDIHKNFHRYGVEWTPNYVKFIFDDDVISTVYKDEPIRSKYHDSDGTNYSADELDDRFKHPAVIPKHPFFWILNTTIERAEKRREKYRPDPDNFQTTKHVIDYVRSYSRCTARDEPKKCFKFRDHDTVYNYNTHRGETASVEMNGFPSPQLKGREMTARITMNQFCEKVKIGLVSMSGQMVNAPIQNDERSSNMFLYDGPLGENETKEIVFGTNQLAAGMYLITAWFEKCGENGRGEGNHVFKIVII